MAKIPTANLVLSVDFDVWHIGNSIAEGTSDFGHCGRCKAKRADGRFLEESRPRKPVDVSTGFDELVPSKKAVLHLIPKGTPVFVAESHADIVPVLKRYYNADVVDLDYHKDDYYEGDEEDLDCATWVPITMKMGLMRRYSRLMEAGLPGFPDAVFTCKSSPYLVKKADHAWNKWLHDLEIQSDTNLVFLGWNNKRIRDDYYRQVGANLERFTQQRGYVNAKG